ncbi:LOW QUALITY PROTEIN: hypothetical protein U9M48_037006 [Paspalum notatum var. saurae]|uniref:NB-ARC domain-containing protein n=1 Tax=Paspalum notatum var. saurae TaxID=547442 RepID=A0AAQ3XBZ3_PASNO
MLKGITASPQILYGDTMFKILRRVLTGIQAVCPSLQITLEMADAILSAIISDVVGRAISLLIRRFTSDRESTEGKLQRISHLLIRIHSVWLSELIDGEYQGCYLPDSISIGCGSQQEADELCGDGKVAPPQVSTLSLFNPAKRVRVAGGTIWRSNKFSWHHAVGADDEIDRVLERLQGMSHDLREFIMLLQDCKPVRRPMATSIFRDGQMFGRHVEKETVINFLLHEDDQSTGGELGVLPIIGANGVGKTTLVQYACDDARVRNHFSVILLCSFSCVYDVKKNKESALDPLDVGDSFCGKKCLLVFEDVYINMKHKLEELLQGLIRCCKEGNKVIITTNNRHVANVGTVEPIAHAFAGADVEDNPRLISAGKEIARKLNGSFFGAKIIGGVIRDHPDPKFWCKVLKSNVGRTCMLGDGMGYISDLAENLLPSHLDMCKVTKVTISKDPSPPRTTEVARLKDVCKVVPHDNKMACWADDARFANVLVCKSVLPFYYDYYIARCSCTCTVGSANSCSKLKFTQMALKN